MKRLTYILFLTIFICGCKDTTDDDPIIDSGNGQDEPTGVLLVFPYEDELCNEGADLTPTESTVFFEWQPNSNAEVYTLSIENLDTGTIIEYETEEFIFPVTIQRANAFRWFVNYNFSEQTQESAIWNFYNAGPGVQTYSPFPAEIISPTMAQTIQNTSSVTLQWNGSDVDNDIVNYDVYFGLNNPPAIAASGNSTGQSLQSVVPGNIYYWNIVTHDAEGNSSESGVYQFKVLE